MRKQLALIFAVLALGLVGCSQGSDNNAAPAQDQTAAPAPIAAPEATVPAPTTVAPDATAPAPDATTAPAPDATAPAPTTTTTTTTQTSAMNNTLLFAENTVAQPAADKKAPAKQDADKSVGGPVDETD